MRDEHLLLVLILSALTALICLGVVDAIEKVQIEREKTKQLELQYKIEYLQ